MLVISNKTAVAQLACNKMPKMHMTTVKNIFKMQQPTIRR